MKKLLFSLGVILPFFASANVVIGTTRVVYPDNQKQISVQLLNNGSEPSLVQAWIDDGDIRSTPETANVPFLLQPPVVKVPAHSGQQLRISFLNRHALQADRESVFYLNVLDIPPVPENMQGKNIMQLAVRSRIKLFLRPSHIQNHADESIQHLVLKRNKGTLTLTNSGPFFITLVGISDGTSKSNILGEGIMVAPYSTLNVAASSLPAPGTSLAVTQINDFGARIQTHTVMQ